MHLGCAVSLNCHRCLGRAGQKLQGMTVLWTNDTYRKVKTLDRQIHPCFRDVWSSHLGLHMPNRMALNLYIVRKEAQQIVLLTFQCQQEENWCSR